MKECPKGKRHCWHEVAINRRTHRTERVQCCKCGVVGHVQRFVTSPGGGSDTPKDRPAPVATDTRKPAGKRSVDELINALKVESNPAAKRKLRAALRAAGHTGGLRRKS